MWPALTAAAALLLGVLVTWMWKPADAPVAGPAGEATFIGSAACKACHADAYAAWHGSQHQRAMQHASEATVRGDFENAKFRYAGVESTFFRRDGKYFVRTDGPDGQLADFEIRYTYGVDPLQQYLIAFPDGRIQALSIAWDTRPKEAGGQRWFHLYPDERVDHRDELHWTKRSQNWNFMCADCHSTNVRKNYDPTADTFKTQWSEITVGCEACHGPGSRHREWAKADPPGADPSRGLTVMLDERRGVAWQMDPAKGTAVRSTPRRTDREIEVCAQCHARRSQIGEGYHAGKPFLDYYRPALLADGLYHADGQQRDEVYVWGSFLQSRMYRAGVTCSDCHEPHSLKLRAAGSAVCAQCHLPAKYDAPAHHFHRASVRCVDCHMPAATYMVVDPRRDHSLRVPRPDLSVALGVPNACNGCHADKTAQWADAAVRKWYGHAPAGFQHYAATLASGRRGSARAGGNLAVLSADLSQPAIARATAAEALARFPSQTMLAALQRGLTDADPLVRRASVTASASVPLDRRVPLVAPLLADPVRDVRIEAAAVLAAAPETSLDPAQRASFARAAAEFEAAQRYNADRPEAQTALGGFYAQRGRTAEAEKAFRAALAMDPHHVPAYVNLADMYRAQARDDDAETVLNEGLKQVPESAALHHARGLALARQKRTEAALAELRRAVELAPDDARFAYVYAVALNSSGQARVAIAEIDRALARHPENADLLNAGAAFARDGGDPAAMARYVERLRALEPSR